MTRDLAHISERLSRSRVEIGKKADSSMHNLKYAAATSGGHVNRSIVQHKRGGDQIVSYDYLPATPKLDLTLSGTIGRDLLNQFDAHHSFRIDERKKKKITTTSPTANHKNNSSPVRTSKHQRVQNDEDNINFDLLDDENSFVIQPSPKHTSSGGREHRMSGHLSTPKSASDKNRRTSFPGHRASSLSPTVDDLVFDDLNDEAKNAERTQNDSLSNRRQLRRHSIGGTPTSAGASPSVRVRTSLSPSTSGEESKPYRVEDLLLQQGSSSPASSGSRYKKSESTNRELVTLGSTGASGSFLDSVARRNKETNHYHLSRQIKLLEESTNRYKKREENISEAYKNEMELSNQLQMQLDKMEKEKASLERALQMANESEQTLTNTLKITKENNENLLKVTTQYEQQLNQQQKQISQQDETISQLKKYKTLYNSLLESHDDHKTQFSSQVTHLKDQIAVLERKLEESDTQRDEMEQVSTQKTKMLNSLQKQLQELQSSQSQKDASSKSLQQDVEHLNNIIHQRELHEKRLDAQLKELQKHSQILQEENDELTTQKQELQRKLNDLSQSSRSQSERLQELIRFELRCTELEEHAQKLRQQLDVQKNSEADTSKELQMSLKQVKVLTTVKTQLEQAIEHKVQTFRKKEAEIERQLNAVRSQMEKHAQQNADLEKHVEELTDQNRRLSKEKHAIQLETRKQLTQKEKHLHHQIQELEDEYRNARREWQTEHDSLKQQLVHHQDTLAKTESEYNEAQSDRKLYQERYQKMLQEKQTLADRSTELESENYSLNLEATRLRKNLDEMKRSMADRSSEVNMYADDFDNIKTKYHKFLSKYDSLLKMHEEAKNMNRRMEESLKTYKKRISSYKEERKLMRHQLEVLQERDFHEHLKDPVVSVSTKKGVSKQTARPTTKRPSKSRSTSSKVNTETPTSIAATKRDKKAFSTRSGGVLRRAYATPVEDSEEVIYDSESSADGSPRQRRREKVEIRKLSRKRRSSSATARSQDKAIKSKEAIKSLSSERKSHRQASATLIPAPKTTREDNLQFIDDDISLEGDVNDHFLLQQMNECIHTIEDDIETHKRTSARKKPRGESMDSLNGSLLEREHVEALESLLEKQQSI